MRPDQVWQAALGELELQMTRASYHTWLRGATLLAHEDGTFIVGVRSAYVKDWLEERLLPTVKRTLAGIADSAAEVRFVVWAEELVADDPSPALPPTPRRDKIESIHENDDAGEKYLFETFVVGTRNRLAHAAALATAENSGNTYNPLFLYGGVGLGKTHLLRAVDDVCSRKGLRVLHVSSEEFTNDLVQAIRLRTTESFRNKYRSLDVLMLDDVHFLAGKESTQEELLHTFNALHARDKQLVFSSALSPRKLTGISDHLRSRFEGGLTVELTPPDRDARLAILRAKAASLSREVPLEALAAIAESARGSVRSLEGALNQVVAQAEILGHTMDALTAAAVLSDQRRALPPLTPEHIVDAVASHFALSTQDLQGRGRARTVALPRQVAMFLIREETSASLPRTGAALGGRDHSTVKYGCEKIRRLIKEDESLRSQVSTIRSIVFSSSCSSDSLPSF